jgi:hypothetical protein
MKTRPATEPTTIPAMTLPDSALDKPAGWAKPIEAGEFEGFEGTLNILKRDERRDQIRDGSWILGRGETNRYTVLMNIPPRR